MNSNHLVNFPHSMRGQVLLEIRGCSKGFLTVLTLPRLALVVDSLNVNSHVVASHELLGTVRTRYCWCSSGFTNLPLLLVLDRSAHMVRLIWVT